MLTVILSTVILFRMDFSETQKLIGQLKSNTAQDIKRSFSEISYVAGYISSYVKQRYDNILHNESLLNLLKRKNTNPSGKIKNDSGGTKYDSGESNPPPGKKFLRNELWGIMRQKLDTTPGIFIHQQTLSIIADELSSFFISTFGSTAKSPDEVLDTLLSDDEMRLEVVEFLITRIESNSNNCKSNSKGDIKMFLNDFFFGHPELRSLLDQVVSNGKLITLSG